MQNFSQIFTFEIVDERVKGLKRIHLIGVLLT